MNAQQDTDRSPITFTIDKAERIQTDTINRKNLGYAALSKIYHELGLHTFLNNRQHHTKNDHDTNSIMKLFVFARLLYPAFKKKTYDNKGLFFEKTDFSLDVSMAVYLFLISIM
ncbi:hypothetical protein KHA94_07140 [Bacillus sp. FJAT-49705]|uniref:Transposase n=1 Tax=Cytobacillus citreus TaxID=2833586 RepID=A0ABS5NST2_9BACI|nr:hypothetical protein [Cytobacillus citreus]MBS4189979.1 hypothetical protein [Cytobacillus citreus]